MDAQISAVDGHAFPDTRRDHVRLATDQRATLQADLLTYHLLRPRACGVADVPLIGEAYRVWSEIWSQTFRELDGATHLPSDDFTRQDEVGALFHGYECIAMCCFRFMDLSNPMFHADSYFRSWPKEAFAKACRDGANVCVANQISVAPRWRKSPAMPLITALTVERWRASDANVLVGTTRDDRRVSDQCARVGCESLGQAEMHGVPVTLIAFYRDTPRVELPEPLGSIVNTLAASIPKGAY